MCRFQSTHPMRGETKNTLRDKLAQINFNPLTPCGVRLVLLSVIFWVIKHFNPLTPCGVRRPIRLCLGRLRLFQSTHPMRGETAFMPQISSAHKCICTKPAPEFSVSCAPPAKIHLIAVLIVQKSVRTIQGVHGHFPFAGLCPQTLLPLTIHSYYTPRISSIASPGSSSTIMV